MTVESARFIQVSPPFDLARTAAPVWWARGRWPNSDWTDGVLTWVGWESGRVVWRSVCQTGADTLGITGSGEPDLDGLWASRVLGASSPMPEFQSRILAGLGATHSGMKPWAAGSLYEGVVSSVVGQSISVAAAATTERRLYALLNEEMSVAGRSYWPPPRADQLASASVERVRTSGVTTKRAQALVEVARGFATGLLDEIGEPDYDRGVAEAQLLAISGIGPWTVRSAFLWGVGDADAHPTGDVALLRAARNRFPAVSSLRDLDTLAAKWAPNRGWAARLLWLDLLGFEGRSGPAPAASPTRHIPGAQD